MKPYTGNTPSNATYDIEPTAMQGKDEPIRFFAISKTIINKLINDLMEINLRESSDLDPNSIHDVEPKIQQWSSITEIIRL